MNILAIGDIVGSVGVDFFLEEVPGIKEKYNVDLPITNAVYSILSPEGFASILWKDSKRANEAAVAMKITAGALQKLKIVDGIIREPCEYTRENVDLVLKQLEELFGRFLTECMEKPVEELVKERYERFRKF